MSKRHQSSRRKNYGRRQHEVAERRHRDPVQDAFEADLDDFDAPVIADRLAFLDPRSPRLSFALGD